MLADGPLRAVKALKLQRIVMRRKRDERARSP
jgi:hypothetical protein